MILVAGIPTEPPVESVIDALQDGRADFVVWNQRRFDDTELSFSIDERGVVDGELRIDRRRWPLHEITAIYARLMDDRQLPELGDEPPDSHRRLTCRTLNDRVATWLNVTPSLVINRNSAMASNASKPYQAQLITAHGFRTPDTLVTNDPARARAFIDVHADVIYKSISGVRSIVQPVTDTELQRLEHIRLCAVQFQALVQGVDVRVHVVGSQVFATEIRSAATDYRYAIRQTNEPPEMLSVELPSDIERQCVELTASLGLEFSGIDLSFSEQGAVYCFEVNPSPGFSYFESFTGQPIAAAVAQHLVAATR